MLRYYLSAVVSWETDVEVTSPSTMETANLVDRPKTRCVKCTPMCASARVAASNIVYQRYGYQSTGTGVLTTKVLLLR